VSFSTAKRFIVNCAIPLLISVLCVSYSNAENDSTSTNHAATRIAPPLKKLASSFKHNANAEAEVILRRTYVTIDEQLMSHSTSYVAVYINSDTAVRDYSQISIGFNSFYEDITLEFANVRTPDGKIDSIKSDATQIQSPTDENFYHDRKELLFSLPNVRKGSVIEFQYRYTDTKKIIPNEWFDSFSFHWWEDRAAGQGSRADAVALSDIQITAPARLQFTQNDTHQFNIESKQRNNGQTQTLIWSGKNIPSIELQNSMPREHNYAPSLRIATMSSWQTVARWANALAEPHLITNNALEKIVADITKNAHTPEEKVKGVYQLIQERVRYVFAHVGRGGYEPHDATEVITNGYGDCKDQSILAVTLLRKLGIEANPALIVTRSRGIPDMNVPNVNFDHMIVNIPAQSGFKEIWMDTTGETSLYPGFSVGIEGQPALIVKESTNQITTLPTLSAAQHTADLELIFDKFDNQDTEASFKITLHGLFEQRLRSMWQYSTEREKYFRDLLGQIYSSGEIIQLETQHADDLWNGFTITGRYRFKNVWGGNQEPIHYGFSINQLLNLFTDLRSLHKPEDRKQPFVNDPGFTLRSKITFASPSNEYQLLLKSQGENINNRYYALTQKGTDSNTRYIIEQALTLKPVHVELKDYADFYAKTQALLNTPDWSVTYNYNKINAELMALQNTDQSDVNNLIALAKHHIKNGQYDKALVVAQNAVKTAPKKAEAYYILGLAQGYNNLFSESDASFKKAEALGYKI